MKILVTGGAGFIGSHIVDAYIKSGHKVVVIDNLTSDQKEFINKKAKFYQVDIRNRQDLEKIIIVEKPQIINHHAAQISVRESVKDPIFDAQVNILGLLNLLEEGKKIDIKKVIFASSGGVVYGEAKIIPTPEDYQPLKPLSPYGISKLTSEYYLDFFYRTYKIPFVALRYGNVYGPRQNPHGEAGVVAIFTKKILNNDKPIIYGDGKQTRDYIYVGDVVEANKIALNRSIIGAFNIATGKQTNVIEIFQKIENLLKSSAGAEFGPVRAGELRKSCLDVEHAWKIMGWSAKIDLDQGLKETIKYFRLYGAS